MPDLFISHASEDKREVARPLAKALMARGFEVWYDETTLTLGDSLVREIDRGLAECSYGVVIISPAFLTKPWPMRELDGLAAREVIEGRKRILPVWHSVTKDEVATASPTLAAKLAVSTSEGIPGVAAAIARVFELEGKGTNSRTSARAGGEASGLPYKYEIWVSGDDRSIRTFNQRARSACGHFVTIGRSYEGGVGNSCALYEGDCPPEVFEALARELQLDASYADPELTGGTGAKKSSHRPSPKKSASRLEVMEAATDFATSSLGPEMYGDEAIDWARDFSTKFTLDDLSRFKKAFDIGRHEIGWDVDFSLEFGRAVLEWRIDQFQRWCKAFYWMISGPMLEPDEAAEFASKFVSVHPIPRLRDLKRGVRLAEDNLELSGFDAVEFALSELRGS